MSSRIWSPRSTAATHPSVPLSAQHVGAIAAAVRNIYDGYTEDPISAQCGIYGDPVPAMLKVVHTAGFGDLRNFYAELERRTSARWVYANMPPLQQED